MFERSLVISQQSTVSSSQRWTTAVSMTAQVALAGLLVTLPMLHPEALPFRSDAPRPLLPNLKAPPVRLVAERSAASSSSTNLVLPTESHVLVVPTGIHHGIPEDDGPPVSNFTGMGNVDSPTDLLAVVGTATTRAVTVAPVRANPTRMRVSEGVSAGMLLTPIRPVYPAIAKATHTEGVVIVEAVISKAGRIESLHVVSGPEMLRRAALEAIEMARYQPYKLNGEPTEVQTTISVNFRIG